MKFKLIITFLALVTLIGGCSKESTMPETDETLYPVTFTISTFSSSITPMGEIDKLSKVSRNGRGFESMSIQGASTEQYWLGNDLAYLYYFVVDKSGTVIKRKLLSRNIVSDDGEEKQDQTFGKIEENLPVGDYTLVVIGASQYVTASNPKEGTNIWVDNSRNEADVFSYSAPIEVINQPMDETIELKRVTGKLEIKFLDGVPDNIERIEYSISNVSSSYYPLIPHRLSLDPLRRASFKANGDFENDLYFYFYYNNYGATSGEAIVNIKAYDLDGKLVLDETINKIPVGVNQKTVLTGSPFIHPENGIGFTVSVNTDWDSTNDIEF